MKQIKKPARNRVLLYFDIVLVLAFVLDMEVHFTGVRIHELLGVGIAVMFLLHIVLHWKWLVGITGKFFLRVLQQSRLSYLLSLALFLDVVVMIVSGIIISRTLGFNFNVRGPNQFPWQQVHELSSQLSLVLAGLHVALSWEWIAINAKKYL